MIERITTCGIAIENGRVLVARRSSGGILDALWEFPGGKNRYGESVEETLKREWREELGVSIAVGSEVGTVDFVNNGIFYHLKAHLVTLLDPINTNKLVVHNAISFVSLGELNSLNMPSSDAQIRDIISLRLL